MRIGGVTMQSIPRRGAVLAVIGVVTTVLAATQAVTYGQGEGTIKLEGAWIARVTSSPFSPGLYQWTYILVPDSSGRRASLHGTVDVGFPGGIPHDRTTPVIGEVRQTGPGTASFNTIWYGLNQGVVVFIGRSWGFIRFVGPGKSEIRHYFEIYLPSSDVDGDGLPDGPPAASFSVTSLDTRVPAPLN
jgi:hypothetical protein